MTAITIAFCGQQKCPRHFFLLLAFVVLLCVTTAQGFERDCDNIIVGAGWSSSYFAWRTTVNSTLLLSERTCFFEAGERVGGRAYSHGDIPGLPGIRIDVGAYRFDTHAMPLSNLVFGVLNTSTKCYDPNKCFRTAGNLRVVVDEFGNDGGYATGPERLVALYEQHGGYFAFHMQLVSVKASGNHSHPLQLSFLNRKNNNIVHLTCQRAFLGIPASAILALEQDSLPLQSQKTISLLRQPQQDPGAKQFLLYDRATWRAYPSLREGLIFDAPADLDQLPPIVGRYHDYYGLCAAPDQPADDDHVIHDDHAAGISASDFRSFHNHSAPGLSHGNVEDGCIGPGALLTYYSFNLTVVQYYAQFQRDKGDPYTYIKYPSGDAHIDAMIKNLHFRLCRQMEDRTKNEEKPFHCSDLPEPYGTIIAVWWAREGAENAATTLLPAPSYIGTVLELEWDSSDSSRFHPPTLKYISDPNHAIRNLMSKPFSNFDLFFANEAFSGGDGWAHPALIMTERIIYHHLAHSIPEFVHDEMTCLEEFSSPSHNRGRECADTVSLNWYLTEIASDPNVQLIPWQDDTADPCLGPCADPHNHVEVTAMWTAPDQQFVRIHYQATLTSASGWIAFGIGQSMLDADIIVGRLFADGSSQVECRHAGGHFQPVKLEFGCDCLAENVVFTINNDTAGLYKAELAFTVPQTGLVKRQLPHNQLAISLDQPTPVILAKFQGPQEDPHSLHQHVAHKHFTISPRLPPAYESDIRPLFRPKDQLAMLFMFDLYRYEDVKENFEEIYQRIEAKTVYGLATGMPVDVTWPRSQLQVLKDWQLAGFPRGQTSFCDGSSHCSCDPSRSCSSERGRRVSGMSIKKCLETKPQDWTVDDLKNHLQLAQALEFSTLPPYLVAYWSVIFAQRDSPQTEEVAASLLFEIILDEMKHYSLVGNILRAIGGQPALHLNVPSYPAQGLPGGVHKELEVSLQGFSKDFLERVAMVIEYPINGSVVTADQDTYAYKLEEKAKEEHESHVTVGQFYDAILKSLVHLTHQGKLSFGNLDSQIDGSAFQRPAFDIFKVANLADAQRAIEYIKDEGEGGQQTPIDELARKAHFYIFAELFHGHFLVQDTTTGLWSYSGDAVAQSKPLFVPKVPAGGFDRSKIKHEQLVAALDTFNLNYSEMVAHLDDAWACDGGEQSLVYAIEAMNKLGASASKILSFKIPKSADGKEARYAPEFLFSKAVKGH